MYSCNWKCVLLFNVHKWTVFTASKIDCIHVSVNKTNTDTFRSTTSAGSSLVLGHTCLSCSSPLSYPAVNRYSSSSLSSQASNDVSNITGQSESSDEVFNMQVCVTGFLYSLRIRILPINWQQLPEDAKRKENGIRFYWQKAFVKRKNSIGWCWMMSFRNIKSIWLLFVPQGIKENKKCWSVNIKGSTLYYDMNLIYLFLFLLFFFLIFSAKNETIFWSLVYWVTYIFIPQKFFLQL